MPSIKLNRSICANSSFRTFSSIARYLKVGKERLNNVQANVFYSELYNTQQVLYAANYAHRNCDIALVSGDAGAGKTTAWQYYEKNNVNVIFVTANSCTKSAMAILSLIWKQIGRQAPGKRSDIMKLLVSVLEGTNRLIIVDEAGHLTLDALQAVRNLNDRAHVGIVLSGNDKIYNQMIISRRCREFDQLRTRIIVRKKVSNDYTIDEMQAMFPETNKDCIGYLLKLACKESLRTAIKIHTIALK